MERCAGSSFVNPTLSQSSGKRESQELKKVPPSDLTCGPFLINNGCRRAWSTVSAVSRQVVLRYIRQQTDQSSRSKPVSSFSVASASVPALSFMMDPNSKMKETLSFSTCFGLVVFYGGNREQTREKGLSKMLCVDD